VVRYVRCQGDWDRFHDSTPLEPIINRTEPTINQEEAPEDPPETCNEDSGIEEAPPTLLQEFDEAFPLPSQAWKEIALEIRVGFDGSPMVRPGHRKPDLRVCTPA